MATTRTASDNDLDTPDRLLLAATQLLDEAQGAPVSTRQITERAGVQAPSLYHHFGSKQALLDAVVSHGFKKFLAERAASGTRDDPIDTIRAGWDSHVAFGLEYPSAYAHIYGNVKPGVPCGVIEDVRAHLLHALEPAAEQGRLRVSSAEAAAEILAASSGVTLALIQQPPDERDLGLSVRMREGVLAAIAEGVAAPVEQTELDASLETLTRALAREPNALTPGERALMQELLRRLAAPTRRVERDLPAVRERS
jgi:AcrR family transcriptional regulator